MRTISTKKLIKNAFRALIKPHKAFKEIPDNQRVNYKIIIPLTLIWGAVFILLNFAIAQRSWLFQWGHALITLISQAIFGLLLWLAGTIFFLLLAKLFRKRVSLNKIEIAVFYLWIVWALMPFFDLPHLIFNLPMWTVFGVGAHFSWLFAFPALIILTFFLLKDLLNFKRKELILAGFSSLFVPFVGRFVLEEIPTFLNNFLRLFNQPAGYHNCASLAVFIVLIFFVFFRKFLLGKISLKKCVAVSSILISLVLFVWIGVMYFTPWLDFPTGGPTLTFYQTSTEDFGRGKSFVTHSYTWVSSDYETGTKTHPPSGAGNDDNDSYWNDEYLDVVDLDFDPTQTTVTVTEIRVKVHFTANTVNNQSGDGPKVQACFAGDVSGAGTYYCSAWATNLNGASDQTFTINESNIRTYVPNGDGVAGGSTEWNNLVSAMTQNDNDVLIHSWTQGDGNSNNEDGDKIEFDSVVVEIDYETEPELTQNHYRWRDDSTALNTEGGWLASEDTFYSTTTKNITLRLRVEIANTGTGQATGIQYQLEYAVKNGANCGDDETFTAVPTSTASAPFEMVDSTQYSDGASITSSFLTAVGTFATGTAVEDPSNKTSAYDLTNGYYTEFEYALKITDNATSSYCFRLTNAGTTTNFTYTKYPEVTIAAFPNLEQIHYHWRNDDGGETSTASPAWYDLNWPYRKKIPIINNTSTELTNYQVKIVVAASTGGDVSCEGHCQDDFGDIRFTKADGTTPLAYWQEPYSITPTSTFWVKIPSLAASTSTNIYMYYGNPSATTTSNGTATFIETFENSDTGFIDFEDYELGDLVGQHGWTIESNTGVMEVVTSTDSGKVAKVVKKDGGLLSYVVRSKYFDATSSPSVHSNIAVSIWAKPSNNAGDQYYFLTAAPDGSDRFTTGDHSDSSAYWEYWDGSWHTTSVTKDVNQWQKIEYRYNGTNLKVYIKGENVYTGTRNTGTIGPAAFETNDTDDDYMLFDNIAVRKYIEPEPTIGTPGNEETSGAATSATGGSEDTPLTNLAKNTTIRLRIEISNEGTAVSSDVQYRLEYGKKTGASCSDISTWVDVGAEGGDWDMSDSAYLTDGQDTTNIPISTGGVTDENTTFLVDNNAVKDTSSQLAPITLAPSEFLEAEFSIKALDGAAAGATYCFRLTNAGTTTNFTYTKYPEVTIAAFPNLEQIHYHWRNDDGGEAAFDEDGIIQENPTGGDDMARAIADDLDYIYIAGYDSNNGNQWRIEKRKKSTGALCTAAECGTEFGSGGVVLSNPSSGSDKIYNIAVDTDYIYLVGVDSTGGNQWRIEKRKKSTGALCTAAECGTEFGSGGVVLSNPSSGSDQAYGIAIDSNYIYVVGWDSVEGDNQLRIEKRKKSTGALCTAAECGTEFGSGGVVQRNPTGGEDLFYTVAVDDDYLYVAGKDNNNGGQWVIEKRNKTTGALCTSTDACAAGAFDGDGIITQYWNSAGSESAHSIAIDSSYLYIAGWDYAGGDLGWRVQKRNKSDGSLVSAFGSNGEVTSDPTTDDDSLYSIKVDSDYIYLGGYENVDPAGDYQWRIEKRNKTTGALCTSTDACAAGEFGSGGVVNVDPSSGVNSDDYVRAVTVDSGYIYITGMDVVPGNRQWRIEKRNIDTGAYATSATSATNGNEDTALTNLAKNTTIRLRIEISNEGTATSEDVQYRLEYGKKTGASCSDISTWVDVGAEGGDWDMSDSAYLTDGQDTTNIPISTGGVTDENTTFLVDNNAVKDTSSQLAPITLAPSEFLEAEFSIKALDGAAAGATYCFRLTNAGTTTNFTYTKYPEVTIAAFPNLEQIHYHWRNDDGGETSTASPAWYDLNWPYRKKIPIINNTSTELTNYQVKIVVAASTGGDVSCEGHCQDDFGDIRFTKADGTTPLAYWQEPYSITPTSSTSTFWVKIPSLAASTSTNIYMYYGNPSATTTSNGNSTFIVFLDFENYNLGALEGQDGWENYNGAGICEIATSTDSGKVIKSVYQSSSFLGGGYNLGKQLFDTATTNIAVHVRSKPTACYPVDEDPPEDKICKSAWTAIETDGSDRLGPSINNDTNWEYLIGAWPTSFYTGANPTSCDVDKWQWIRWEYNGTNEKLYIKDSLYYEGTNKTGIKGIGIETAKSATNGDHHEVYWDDWFVRNYVEPEPTIGTPGNEETSGAATSATGGSEDTPLTNLAKNTTIRLRIEISNEGTAVSSDVQYRLEYGKKTGASCSDISTWVDVGAEGGDWDMSDSAYLTDGQDTTNIPISTGGVTDENTTFLVDNNAVKDTSSQLAPITLAPSEFLEAEFSIKALDGAAAGATYCFRLTNAGTTTNFTYTKYPEVTIVSNQPPTIESISISPSPINLNADSTTTVTITATISDPDGCEDVFASGTISGVFYDAGAETDSCTADDNDCYPNLIFTEVDDTCSGAGDTTAEAQATVDVWFHANASNQWTAKVTATDSQSQSATNTQTVTINELAAFKLDVSSIDYGTVNPNEVSAEKAVKITTIGNVAVDVKLSGEDLTWSSYTIPVSQQKYSSTSGFDWETEGTALTGTPTCYELSTGKPTQHPSNQSEYIYWKLKVPLDKPAETYSGNNTFDVVSDSTCP